MDRLETQIYKQNAAQVQNYLREKKGYTDTAERKRKAICSLVDAECKR